MTLYQFLYFFLVVKQSQIITAPKMFQFDNNRVMLFEEMVFLLNKFDYELNKKQKTVSH